LKQRYENVNCYTHPFLAINFIKNIAMRIFLIMVFVLAISIGKAQQFFPGSFGPASTGRLRLHLPIVVVKQRNGVCRNTVACL
jgi:hypothetical protein